MRTVVSPGSNAQVSAAMPERAISAMACSKAAPLGNEKEAWSSKGGSAISRMVISALMPSVPQSPLNRPVRSGPKWR